TRRKASSSMLRAELTSGITHWLLSRSRTTVVHPAGGSAEPPLDPRSIRSTPVLGAAVDGRVAGGLAAGGVAGGVGVPQPAPLAPHTSPRLKVNGLMVDRFR